MRAGLIVRAALTPIVLTLVSPAHACRLYTIWHYPWKQHCQAFALARKPTPTPTPTPPPPPPVMPAVWRTEETIPLPDLRNIEWGQTADAEIVARAMLRAKMEGKQ